ncbi:MAG: RNA 2',3'-cyclic phosphodiesterase, partial [Acidiferrobacterales bacterium]|nr:RNA 2',3'-cyclic phosphodiesterase [Acidiferrobacterales bacterium]
YYIYSPGIMSIRSFIAIPIESEQANTLGDCAAKMAYQDKSNAVRWVDQSNFHITLAFLGDQQEHVLEELAERLDQQLPEIGFQVPIAHLSPFPESRPKLIAAIVKKSQDLIDLQQRVINAISSSSIKFEKRKFLPHITLGRYRHSKNHFAGGIPTNLDLTIEVNEVTLFESILTPTGAQYEALFRFPLDEIEYDEV